MPTAALRSKTAEISIQDLLKECVLFRDADDAALSYIATTLERIEVSKGEPIVLENEASGCVYFIERGTAEVVKQSTENRKSVRLALLHEGSNFSEFSVLTRAPRSASVFAYSNCTLLKMKGEAFMGVLKKFPPIAKSLVQSLAQIHYQQFSSRPPAIENHRKFEIGPCGAVLKAMNIDLWRAVGALPLRFESNVLNLAVRDPYGIEYFEQVHRFFPNVQVNVSLVDGEDFENLIEAVLKKMGEPIKPRMPLPPVSVHDIMRRLPFLSGVNDHTITQIIPYLKRVQFGPGEVILAPGFEADHILIFESGEAIRSRELPGTSVCVQVGVLRVGDSTGDVPLLAGFSQLLHLRALTPVKILILPRHVVDKLLDSPLVSIPFAQHLATKIQTQDQSTGLRRFNSGATPDVVRLSHLVPKSVMLQYRILPLKLADNELVVGVTQPNDELLHSVIGRYLSGYSVSLELITEGEFSRWSALIEGSALAQKTRRTGGATSSLSALPGGGEEVDGSQLRAVDILDQLVTEGLLGRASDLHFEPTDSGYVTRYRVDGVLHEAEEKIPIGLGEEVLNRIKVLSQMDVTQRMLPQDGQLKMKLPTGQDLMARVSTMPTKHGENAVLRIIRNKTSFIPLKALAPDRRTIQILSNVVRKKQGLFLVTGPTGSGKTTTLYSLLSELNRVGVNVISLEDPVELEIPGITQIEMNEKQGLTFARAARGVLRQDPNVIMVGEIRDAETATTVVEAAQTGHLVISTLHTNGSLDVSLRLTELGISPVMLSSSLLGAVAQRLVRSICKKCQVESPVRPEETAIFRERLGWLEIPQTLRRGKGCSACKGTGYHDRIPIFEIWQKSVATEQVILKGGTAEDLLVAVRKDGFISLSEFALKMVLSGLTTIDEVDRQFGVMHTATL